MIEPRSIQVIDQRQIEELAMQAIAVRRRRAHLLLHDGPADPVSSGL
jgi:hypothetical protein